MNTLFRSLRNAAEKIGLVESYPYGRTVCKTWRIGDAFTEKVTEKYPDVDVDAQFGGQPIYYYVLAVE